MVAAPIAMRLGDLVAAGTTATPRSIDSVLTAMAAPNAKASAPETSANHAEV